MGLLFRFPGCDEDPRAGQNCFKIFVFFGFDQAKNLSAVDEVIDVEGKTGIVLMNQALFANFMRALDDETAQT